MRKTCLEQVYELAKKDERVFLIGSDLGFKTLQEMRDEFPDRYIMEGISEGNLVGMSAGMAMEGKIVYANTIATFLSRRCFEQIVLDMGLHKTNVRLIANGGGVVYAPLGPTHLAIDDIAILRTVPNMTIVSVADANEMKRFMPLTLDYDGPIYIRLAKGHDPIVTRDDIPFEIGKAIPYGEGKDALLVTTGIGLRECLGAAEQLKADGIDVTILHMHTIKPFDTEALLAHAAKTSVIVSVEEHTIVGGLGGAVAEVLAEECFDSPKRFKRVGLPDVFPTGYGSQAGMMADYGISPEGIAKTVKDQINQKVSVTI